MPIIIMIYPVLRGMIRRSDYSDGNWKICIKFATEIITTWNIGAYGSKIYKTKDTVYGAIAKKISPKKLKWRQK